MHWYLVQTKPKQEKIALLNLERQGFHCYLPTIPVEKLRNGSRNITYEPLFPRYLFIYSNFENENRSWTPIRSTKGVSRLISFGNKLAKVDEALINLIKKQEINCNSAPEHLFTTGQHIKFIKGPFANIEGIYQIDDGQHRVIVLIEILSRPVVLNVDINSIRKIG